jgi:deubiquitinase DESI2
VYGYEWAFGYCPNGSGVYRMKPMRNTMYMYRESLQLGHTALSETQFKNVLKQLQEEFQGATYDLLTRNCCHFCEALCDRLRCDPIPGALQLLSANCEHALVCMYEGL